MKTSLPLAKFEFSAVELPLAQLELSAVEVPFSSAPIKFSAAEAP